MARRRANKKNIKPPLSYVEWADHHANGAWQGEIDHTPAVCCSIGWLVKEDSKGLSIAASKGKEDKLLLGNTQYIIKSCIITRKSIDV